METKLTRIAELAKSQPKMKFTSLVHLQNEESLKQCHQKQSKEWLRENRHENIHIIMDRFSRSLKGYYNYYCITDNTPQVNNFKDKVQSLIYKWLNKRSQKKSFNWDKFLIFIRKHPLPIPKVKVNIYDLRKEISYIL